MRRRDKEVRVARYEGEAYKSKRNEQTKALSEHLRANAERHAPNSSGIWATRNLSMRKNELAGDNDRKKKNETKNNVLPTSQWGETRSEELTKGRVPSAPHRLNLGEPGASIPFSKSQRN